VTSEARGLLAQGGNVLIAAANFFLCSPEFFRVHYIITGRCTYITDDFRINEIENDPDLT
jgi:hypothetical protein